MAKTLLIISIVASALVLGVAVALIVRNVLRRRAGEQVRLAPMIYTASAMFLVNLASVAGLVLYERSMNDMQTNPFFTEWDTPFGVPPFDKIKVEDYMPAFERGMQEQISAVDSIVSNPAAPTFDNVILAFDRSGDALMRVANVLFMLCDAESTPEMQQIQEQISPRIAAHSDSVLFNDRLFAKVKSVYDTRYQTGLDSAKVRLTEKTYKRFVRSGALLDSLSKSELKSVNSQLALLDVKFTANVLSATNDFKLVLGEKDLEGLPPALCTSAQQKATELGMPNKYVFTLQAPDWIPFLTYSSRPDLRQKIYEAYLNRCAAGTKYDNTQIVNDIVRLRLRKAQLLGFDSYAAYVLDDQMAKTPAKVYELLDTLWQPAVDKAKADLAMMRRIKWEDIDAQSRANAVSFDENGQQQQPSAEADSIAREQMPFDSWDWWYYAEKVRRTRYNFDEETVKPYLSLNSVRQGIFDLANRLYGITFRPINAPVYDKECEVYEVLDRDNTHLAVLYLDFFPRDGKLSGAWCGEFRPQYFRDGKRVAPVVSIVCNFTRPNEDGDALLSVDETETFFHEFGHALHNFFKTVPYEGLNDVERDFVELPSQIMENWAFSPEWLKCYAFHYRTGEVLPERLIMKLKTSREFNQGFALTELLAASLTDMDIHSMTTYSHIDLGAFDKYQLQNKRGLIPQIEPRYRLPYFKHIFGGGYAAGYYSYLWAEVLDKDAFEAFRESGDVLNPKVARRFRDKVLSQGGLKDGMRLYRDFRGKDPSRVPLLKARGLWVEPDTVKVENPFINMF